MKQPKITQEVLHQFLLKANMPHADGSADLVREEDGSQTIAFEDGDWRMHDNFFGGEPYGGRQVVFHEDTPVWICLYYGQVPGVDQVPDKIYDFLREALQHPLEDMPYRGPKSYKKAGLEYKNALTGAFDNYSGREVILKNGKEVYWATYFGGLIDQRYRDSL